MLRRVRSKWITVLAGAIAAVVLISVAIGLTSPDGTVGDKAKPSATATRTTPSPSPTTTTSPPTPSAKPAKPTAARAPVSVRGPWPGHPASVTEDGDSVDWCPAVRTTGAAEAEDVFGKAAVDRAACAAVRFT